METTTEVLNKSVDDVAAYRIKVSVRNNLLLSAIEDAGYKNLADFARAAGVTYQTVVTLVSFKLRPINPEGEFRLSCKKIMETLGAAPTDLWTAEQLELKVRRNSVDLVSHIPSIQSVLGSNVLKLQDAVKDVDYVDAGDPEAPLEEKEFTAFVEAMLSELTPREAKVIRYRFGLGAEQKTLTEVSHILGVTRERVRQIEEKALRKFRSPGRMARISRTGYRPNFDDDMFSKLLKCRFYKNKLDNEEEDGEQDDEQD